MSFAQVAKGYLSTIANKNSFSLITNMRVASVSTGRAGGGGGEVEFLTEKKNSAKKCSWGLKTPKKIKNKFFFLGGGGGGRKISEFFFPTKIFFSKMFLGF